jgi:hypothetical protein
VEWIAALQEFFVVVYGPLVIILLPILIAGGIIYGLVSLMIDVFYS